MKRVCVLTGASGTFGNAFCERYAREYEIAAVCNRNLPQVCSQKMRFFDPLYPTKELAENNSPIFTIPADLADISEQRRVLELVLARYGRVDVLIYAAVNRVWSPIITSEHLLESAAQQFEVNVLAPLRMAALLARRCWRDVYAENVKFNRNIINLSSTAGSQVYCGSGQSIYSATKASLNILTRHMAEEFASIGIRVNAVAPNSFPTHVPTERVLEAVRQLDEGKDNGEIVKLE